MANVSAFIIFSCVRIAILIQIFINEVSVILSLPFVESGTKKYIFFILALLTYIGRNLNIFCSCYCSMDKDEFIFHQRFCCCQAEMNIILSFLFCLTQLCPKTKPRPRADKYFIRKRKISKYSLQVYLLLHGEASKNHVKKASVCTSFDSLFKAAFLLGALGPFSTIWKNPVKHSCSVLSQCH